MAKPVLQDRFGQTGRGPTLVKVHYTEAGSGIAAVDYQNPDESRVRHLIFRGAQVFMFTPEEVVNHETGGVEWRTAGRAAAVNLGRSPWLRSFAQRHLERCAHYRVMFYEEYLDIICEGIEAGEGGYVVPDDELSAGAMVPRG